MAANPTLGKLQESHHMERAADKTASKKSDCATSITEINCRETLNFTWRVNYDQDVKYGGKNKSQIDVHLDACSWEMLYMC